MIEFSQIDEVLRAEDIEGLIQLGAPADEYSSEATSIATALKKFNDSDVTEALLYSIVSQVWDHSFGPFDDDALAKRSAAFHRAAQFILKV